MASYFIASSGRPGAAAAVHDRGRCLPQCFPEGAVEYLGEFLEAGQALAVARVRFPQACHCPCCVAASAPATAQAIAREPAALTTLRS